MKINKYISLDTELVYKLQKEENASNIINELLKSYYNTKDIQNVEILEQELSKIKQIIKENRRKAKEFTQQIDKIRQKNKDFFSIFKKNYPEKLIERLKKIQNLDYETAFGISKEFDLHKRGIGGVKLIKIWEEIKKDVV